MTKEELKITKMNMLGAMHSIVMEEVADKNLQEQWLICCVPDNPSEDDLKSIAEDEDLWTTCCWTFGEIMVAEGRM